MTPPIPPGTPVTVVMRCKNNAWSIDRALAALFSQRGCPFSLLLVDSGSTDQTRELAGRYPHRRLDIDPDDYFPGAVLNRALEATTSEVVVFLNADCVLATPDSLAALVAALTKPDVVAAFGRQVVRPEAESGVCRDHAAAFPEEGAPPLWVTLSLPVAAMRRSAWEARRFYTDAWGSEDTAWGLAARFAGERIAYVPEALAMHSHNYTLRQRFGRRFIEGEADAFLYGAAGGGVFTCLARALADSLRDARWCLSSGHLGDLVLAPVRRSVGHYAYWRGRRHGLRRRRQGDRDASLGQRVVLARHESVRPR